MIYEIEINKSKQKLLVSEDYILKVKDSENKNINILLKDYIEYIEKTTKLLSKGKFKRALVRYETILKTYPDDLNGNFYGGLCLYNLEDYQSAIHHFRKCIASPFFNFDEESQWLIGNSYEKLGQTEKARSVYQKIVDQNGYYKKQAQAKLSAK